MSTNAVWITGVGTANPLGTDWASTAEGLLRGACGIRQLRDYPLPDHLSKVAARLGAIPTPTGCDVPQFPALAPIEQLSLWCSIRALQTAGLWDRRQELRVGVVLGLGSEWMSRWEVDHYQGGHRIGRPEEDTESVVELVQRRLALHGPGTTVAAACASGNHALALGRRWVRLGWAEVCLAGAGDIFATPMAMSCFGNLRALSRRNDDPQGASRPFDRDRDGFVVGEGGAVFVLESEEHARRRGAQPLAELAGFGASSDAHHMVIPSPNPEPAILAMREALADAQVNPDEVDYVNAHATSTPAGDTSESRVLHEVLGPATHSIPVSSTKSMTGHLLSGAAAMNALACLVALEEQALPPTINLDHPDPECDLCHVPKEARPHPVQIAVSNSLGFGGSNTTLVLRKVA
jgi:3-oxoacyl-[acyl-carrier-protein] synthase II